MFGIDVSKYQGNVDWDIVKPQIDFAIARCGYGMYEYQKDPTFENNYNDCKKLGIPLGTYAYSYAMNIDEVLSEADCVLEWIDGKSFSLPVFFDIEESRQANLGKDMCTQMCIAFCDKIRNAGYGVGIYANTNWFTNYLDVDELRNKGYMIWKADFRGDNADKSIKCDIWQYTSVGRINGISGDVDLNESYFDIEPETPSEPEKPTQPDEDINPQGIKKGDKVTVTNPVDYDTGKKFILYYTVYDVFSISGNRAVIGIGNVVTSAINVKYLSLYQSTKPTPPSIPDQSNDIKAGDVVTVTNPVDYDTGRKFILYYNKYDVLSMSGNRAVIGIGNVVTSAINVKYLKKAGSQTVSQIKAGDTVKVINAVAYNGKSIKLYYDYYTVMELKGDRAVIGVNGVVTCAINIKNIRKV